MNWKTFRKYVINLWTKFSAFILGELSDNKSTIIELRRWTIRLGGWFGMSLEFEQNSQKWLEKIA